MNFLMEILPATLKLKSENLKLFLIESTKTVGSLESGKYQVSHRDHHYLVYRTRKHSGS